jgi:polyhydroxybutyrate depolymerase
VNKTTTAAHTHGQLAVIVLGLLGAAAAGACGGEEPASLGAPLTPGTGASPTMSATGAASMTSSATPTATSPATQPTTQPTPTMTATATMSNTTKPPPAFPTALPSMTSTVPSATMTDDEDPPVDTMPDVTMPTPTTDPTDQGTGGTGDPGEGDGGAGGDMGEGGDGNTMEPGGMPAVDPSDGCGKANPQTGSSGSPLMASDHQYYVKLPGNYDENTPYKVMIMFNPTNNPIGWAEQSAGYESAASDAIRVYPHSTHSSSGWGPDEIPFFQGLYDAVVDNFCVDKARVFAGGESSGGEFSGFIGCEYGDLLRGVAPGAPKQTSWAVDVGQHECKGNPAAIVIWSPADNVLQQPTGPDFRDFYAELNECSDMSNPVDGFTDDQSNCEQFDGCADGSPVYFCQHNDPTYSNSFHGWPAFAAEMTWGVFSEL